MHNGQLVMRALVLGTWFKAALREAGSDRVNDARSCNVTANSWNGQWGEMGTSGNDQRHEVVYRNAANIWDKERRDYQHKFIIRATSQDTRTARAQTNLEIRTVLWRLQIHQPRRVGTLWRAKWLKRSTPSRVCETAAPGSQWVLCSRTPWHLSLHQSLTQTVVISETPNKHFKTIAYRGGGYKPLLRIHSVMPQKTQRRLTKATEGPGVAKHINTDKRAAIKHNKFY